MSSNMSPEEKIFAGKVFNPGEPELAAIKARSHALCREYNAVPESDAAKRSELLHEILGELGEGSGMTAPIFFHYGKHTKIGKRFFGNYDLTVQDDAEVTIGDDCNFGPKVTIVTPMHPIVPEERFRLKGPDGKPTRVCWAKPVHIGNDCWFGANVTVCPGVTIGDGCVIGAGSVVTKDIPPHTVAAGNPCRVIREISEKDSMINFPDIADGCTPYTPEEIAEMR